MLSNCSIRTSGGLCICDSRCRELSCAYRVTEINFDAAIEEAERLDAHFARTGKVVGPMHGVPISVKVSSFYNAESGEVTFLMGRTRYT